MLQFRSQIARTGRTSHATGGAVLHACQRRTARSVKVCAAAADAPSTSGRAIPIDTATVRRVKLRTQKNCELAVSVYPMFAYNALGGGGWATVTDEGQGIVRVQFDADGLVIPPLCWKTASIFGVPIPPPLNIAIKPQRLEGTMNTITGEVNLNFDAEFEFTAGPLYKAPPLVVKTLLTTGTTQGRFRKATGSPVVNGVGKLVGAATVEKTGDAFMDTFLMLPTDALAIMVADFAFE
mmetsp:Transcript_7349/g.18236  ORF Transcript_7349/g.18236 Transcript_7349/m.18236 type:complete len:237 (-) Transcript_7349:358-1068(-)